MKTTVTFETPEEASIVVSIMAEIRTAKLKYPIWPKCNVKRAAIVSEESGELVREANQLDEGKGSFHNLKEEAIQTAAMAIRMIMEIASEKENNN